MRRREKHIFLTILDREDKQGRKELGVGGARYSIVFLPFPLDQLWSATSGARCYALYLNKSRTRTKACSGTSTDLVLPLVLYPSNHVAASVSSRITYPSPNKFTPTYKQTYILTTQVHPHMTNWTCQTSLIEGPLSPYFVRIMLLC